MKLLIITQQVNRTDPILGFFHRWIVEFSKHFESITVICLQKGEYDLPSNVNVLSLGKEEKQSRSQYLWRFYSYVWSERRNYDVVLSHMNQEYVFLAGWLWKILGKRIYMWRNHYAGDELTDMAAAFCAKIFCTSRHSYTAKYKKTVLMPVGVDTDLFKPDPAVTRVPDSILSLGRIAPSKKLDVLISALRILKDRGVSFTASFYGDADGKDESYDQNLRESVHGSGLESVVRFFPAVPNDRTPLVYSAHDIFVNLSPSGMYDKTIFESMACGCKVLVSNKDIASKIDAKYVFRQDDEVDLADKLGVLLSEPAVGDEKLQKYAAENHSLVSLATELASAMSH